MRLWLASLLAILLLGATLALAHDWYPAECCSGNDCAPVEVGVSSWNSLVPGELPTMMVTTIHGTVPVPPTMLRRPSPDGRMHACIHNGELLCFFVPPGS